MDNNSRLPVSLPEICVPREDFLRLFDRAAERFILYLRNFIEKGSKIQ